MNDKELKRFDYEDIKYVIGMSYIPVLDKVIPSPFISVTTKSAKKHRTSNPGNKHLLHFNLLSVSKPIILFRKVYDIINDYLKDEEYVIFSANSDKQLKRETLYLKALLKMGFMYYFTVPFDYYGDSIFMSRAVINNKYKRKIITSLKTYYD